MPILLDHITEVDKIKDKIERESEEILKVINLSELLELNRDEKINYLKEILYDYWENQESRIQSIIDLGEEISKDLIRAI